MKLVFANGTELEVTQVVESIFPKNTEGVKNGRVLEIRMTDGQEQDLEELVAMFTPETCARLDVVADYGTVGYTGYTTLLNVSGAISQTTFVRSIRLALG